MGSVLLAFVLGLGGSLALTPLVRRWAIGRGYVAKPRPDRWSQRVTALMGGLAIVGGTALGVLPLVGQLGRSEWTLLAAAGLMFVVGVIDDRRGLRPQAKLLAQLIAAIGLVDAGFRFGLADRWPAAHHFEQIATVVFLVGVGNALNLLDNMDGLCAGIAAIAAAALLTLQAESGQFAAAALTAALGGACLGFLRYNFAPASVFMGDCGSLFIGLYLGAAALVSGGVRPGERTLAVVFLPVLVLLIPLLDTTLVTFARKWARRPVSQGGCDHTSHRLVAIGLSERRAVLFLYTLGAAGGLVAWAVRWLDWTLGNLVLPLFLVAAGGVGLYLGQVRVYADQPDLGDLLDRTPIPLLAQHRHRRRMLELLVDTVLVAVAFYTASLLKYEGQMATPARQAVLLASLPLVVATQLLASFASGVYGGIWRHTSVNDLPRFALAAASGLLLLAGGGLLRGQLEQFSPGLLATNLLCQFLLLAGSRLGVRVLHQRLLQHALRANAPAIVVVGNTLQADLALRGLRNDPSSGWRPVGVICDEPRAVGLQLHGTPVLATSETAREALAAHPEATVVLVDREFPAEAWERLRRLCQELRLAVAVATTELRAADDPRARSA
ncbi:MAG: hypothetical protein IT204_13875 [Fimbriimonadaceae bacterium]|nr:hypothetical protein [Fimbriimonadaceae bacterium]